LKLNLSYKDNFLIAAITSIWLILFLVLIAPFDIAELSFQNRLILMPLYGVISFLSYIIFIPLQNWLFQKVGKWNLYLELGFIILFNIIAFLGCYIYYQSDIINGNYPLRKFALEVYYPIFLILLTIIIFLRWFLFRIIRPVQEKKIILKGENKLDVLQIHFSNLVCVSSSDNYVEIYYLENGMLQKKLLRNTLKNIQQDEPRLLKVHRSYLINPFHLLAWKNATTIQLTQIDVPVTRNFKNEVFALLNRP